MPQKEPTDRALRKRLCSECVRAMEDTHRLVYTISEEGVRAKKCSGCQQYRWCRIRILKEVERK